MGLLLGSRADRRRREAVRDAFTMTDHDAARIVERAQARLVEGNEVIIAEGDTATEMFIIVSGKFEVSLSSDGATYRAVRMLGAGSCVGEMGLLDGAPRRATVTCRTNEGEVLALTATDVRYLLDGQADARRTLSAGVAERQDQLTRATA